MSTMAADSLCERIVALPAQHFQQVRVTMAMLEVVAADSGDDPQDFF